jgi:hypothetical protein
MMTDKERQSHSKTVEIPLAEADKCSIEGITPGITPAPKKKCAGNCCGKKKEPGSMVDHPAHYNTGKCEVIDVLEDWDMGFHCGNAIKYISRHKHKMNPAQDIEKAIWYLQRYLGKMNEDT